MRRSGADLSTFKDFPVRRAKVLTALQWLQNNNPYYRDITINQVNLAALPEDGHVDNQLRVIIDDLSNLKAQTVSRVANLTEIPGLLWDPPIDCELPFKEILIDINSQSFQAFSFFTYSTRPT